LVNLKDKFRGKPEGKSKSEFEITLDRMSKESEEKGAAKKQLKYMRKNLRQLEN